MSGSTGFSLSSLVNTVFPGLYVANLNFDDSSSPSTGSYTFNGEASDQGELRSGLADTTFTITASSATPPADDPNALGTLTIQEATNGVNTGGAFVVNVLGFNGNTLAVGVSPADTTSSNPYQSYLAISDNNLGLHRADNQAIPSYPETFSAATTPSFAVPTSFDLTKLVGITYPGLNVGAVENNTAYSAPAQQIYTFSEEISNQGETRSGLAGTTFAITAATNGAPSTDPNAVGTVTVQETTQGVNTGGPFVLNVLGYSNNAIVTGNPLTVNDDGTYGTYIELSDVNIGLHTSDDPTPPVYPQTFTAFNATTFVPPCFVTGARILTARGEVAVEDLAVGDEATTASGGRRTITWIGQRAVAPRGRAELNPVCVAAGAFAPGVPNADLWLSPGHSVYADGALIPVSFLINGITITQHVVAQITYWHVELDQHDVLISQNLPSESYLDTGNRNSFSNAGGAVAMVPNFAPAESALSCAPLVLAGPVLAAVRERLLGRIAAFGYVEAEHEGLRILADGVPVAALQSGRTLRVSVPAGTRALTLVSSSGIPAHHDAQSADTRRLGVAIEGLRIDSETVSLADVRLVAGFHSVEGGDGAEWRWTDGRATVSVAGNEVVELDIMPTRGWVDYVASAADERLAG